MESPALTGSNPFVSNLIVGSTCSITQAVLKFVLLKNPTSYFLEIFDALSGVKGVECKCNSVLVYNGFT